MVLLKHKNIGNVLEHVYLAAIITKINNGCQGEDLSLLDTVDFTGIDECPDGKAIPLFYHCAPDSVLRDNGALEGAAGAFKVDDEIMVQCEIESAKHYMPLRVVGFKNIKPRNCCFPNIRLLTYMGEEDCLFRATSFCLRMDEGEDCEVRLTSNRRILHEAEINYLSQCRYVYTDEESGITRKVSLFQYHHYHWETGAPYIGRTIRIIGHENSADIHFTEIHTPPGPLATILATLSEDLKTLYLIRFAPSIGWLPEEVWFTYHQYDLVDTDEGREWKKVKSGITPTHVADFEALALDRSGKCGCWKHTRITEHFSKGDASTVYINCLDSHTGSWKDGTRYQYTYKTFDINTEKFVNSGKVRDLHLSPSAKDYVVCKALPGTASEYPTAFAVCTYSCNCERCVGPPPVPRTQDAQTTYKTFRDGGSSNEAVYRLFNGWDEFDPDWDASFYADVEHLLNNRGNMVQNCPPGFGGCEYGSGEKFIGIKTRALGIPYTSSVLAQDAEQGTWVEKKCSSCWPMGWAFILPCGGAETWGGWYTIVTRCGGNIYDRSYAVNTSKKLLLSPFDMVFAAADFIGNTFISYDQETDSLIRGVQYQRADESMKWKVWAEIPDCPDKSITDELENLLSAEYFLKMEAIIFV